MDKPAPSPSDTDRGRTLGQILIVLVVIVLLVNVPISYHGAGLIHSVPEATPVVIYNGMALKDSGQTVYILENHQLRSFSSPDTFDYFRKRYHLTVNRVDDNLLAQFALGRPIRRLVKCDPLSKVYALENGQKRLVEGSLSLSDQANRWDEVSPIACNYLRNIPDGPPIHDEEG